MRTTLRRCCPRLLSWLLLAAFCLPATHAQTRAWLDRDRIALGETATLNIETDQADAQPPDYAALEADFVASGHSSRRGVEVVNGRRQARVLFAVALRPRREGVLAVPALRVGAESTPALALTVEAAAGVPAAAGAPVFVESEIDAAAAYVQQSIGYVLRLHYATPLVSGQLEQPPAEGAAIQRVGGDVQYTRDIGGRSYTVVERRFQIVPERSGPLTIPGARFTGRGVGGFFEGMFGDGRRELQADGASHLLQVRAMPDDAPQPWLPLRGLALRYVDAPREARVGEAVTVTVELRADGAVGTQLPELRLGPADGAQLLAEPPQVDETFDGTRLRATLVRRFAVVPERDGTLRIPGPRQVWWDAEAGVARTAALPDLVLQVAPGAGAPMAVAPAAAPAVPRSASAVWWPWAALGFALLWLATLAWALRSRWRGCRRRRGAGGESAGSAPPAAPTTSLRMLAGALAAGGLDEVETVLCGLSAPPSADLDALAALLDDPEQRAAVALLQQARWGGGDPAAARQALRAAFRGGPRLRGAVAAPEPPLPPLYP